jgi:hypothetical protein
MTTAYRLLPAHRRKLRRMRALVEAASGDAAEPADGRPTPEQLAEAQEYLATHSSCEAYLLAQATGATALKRARCAQGYGRKTKFRAPARIRTCPTCNKQKSVLSFDNELGKCIKCKYEALDAGKRQKKVRGRSKKPAPAKGDAMDHTVPGSFEGGKRR